MDDEDYDDYERDGTCSGGDDGYDISLKMDKYLSISHSKCITSLIFSLKPYQTKSDGRNKRKDWIF